MTTYAQNNNFTVSKDSANGSLVFNGIITIGDLNNEPSFTWMKKGYDDYHVNEQIEAYLKQNLSSFSIVVFLGTWCDDSHYWMPKFVKLLNTINYPLSKLTMYGVDRAKKTKNGENTKYNISMVPTIILLKDNIEIGRITESPKNGLEADIQDIISIK